MAKIFKVETRRRADDNFMMRSSFSPFPRFFIILISFSVSVSVLCSKALVSVEAD